MAFFREENLWLYLPLIAWIGGIFYLSSNKGSMSRTAIYFAPLLDFLFPRDDARAFKKHHFVVRKMCHFVGYAVLALLASLVFYNSSLLATAKFWYAGAFAVVLVVASIDEIRQSFYPERVGSLSDVALDCAGGLTMILLFWIFAANRF
jgi:VanZ family protein